MSRKVLVAVAAYPDNNGSKALMYVHTRNLYYNEKGIDVTVLNFSTKVRYELDDIPVISLQDYLSDEKMYDILICHAPNLRNHFIFLRKYGNRFSHFIFFFHGHEVLKRSSAYCRPYPYKKTSMLKKIINNTYDTLKLKIWHYYYLKVKQKSSYVFVSNWMLQQFEKWTKINHADISDQYMITYNGIGQVFENARFDEKRNKEYDFITIRNDLDGAKYCIDLVNEFAKKNQELRFLVIGKGTFFSHYEKADNIVWRDTTLQHQEIIDCLQTARCGLMLTRTDAQGLMSCEIASTGMPVITSDIEVCHEVFDGFENVTFIPNDISSTDILPILEELEKHEPYSKNSRYYTKNTAEIEKQLIDRLCNMSCDGEDRQCEEE